MEQGKTNDVSPLRRQRVSVTDVIPALPLGITGIIIGTVMASTFYQRFPLHRANRICLIEVIILMVVEAAIMIYMQRQISKTGKEIEKMKAKMIDDMRADLIAKNPNRTEEVDAFVKRFGSHLHDFSIEVVKERKKQQ